MLDHTQDLLLLWPIPHLKEGPRPYLGVRGNGVSGGASGAQRSDGTGPPLRGVREILVHAWRYRKPIEVAGEPAILALEAPPLVPAGDSFGGGRVEGAAISGWAAADALMR